MDAMTIYRRCREAKADIDALETRIRQRREALTQVTQATGQEGGRSGSGPSGDRMAAVVAAIADLDSKVQTRRQRQSVEIAAACVLCDIVEERYSRVLHLYYVQGLTVRSAAKRLHFSEGYVRKLKRDAEDAARAIPEATVRSCVPDWYE